MPSEPKTTKRRPVLPDWAKDLPPEVQADILSITDDEGFLDDDTTVVMPISSRRPGRSGSD